MKLTPLAVFYLIASILGFVGTWTWNVVSIVQQRNFIGDWVGSGPSVSSLTVDILIACVVAATFIVAEGRRLGMRRLWLYIVLMAVIAFAFAFPFFLFMRERALSRRALIESETR